MPAEIDAAKIESLNEPNVNEPNVNESREPLPLELAASSDHRASWWDWAQFVRLPNTFTVLADTTAGFLLAAGGLQPWQRYLPMMIAVVALYWSGMALNDLLDVEQDRKERPHRPIASGRISKKQATITVWGLLGIGILAAALSGWIPAPALQPSALPLVVGIGIAIAVFLYDGPFKRTPLGPVFMGLCRVGSLLLGAAPVVGLGEHTWFFPLPIWGAAVGMGIFIAGITWAGRHEAAGEGDTSWGPLGGFVTVIVGLVVLGLVPRLGEVGRAWRLDEQIGYPSLIGLLGLTVLYRGVLAVRWPQPMYLQAFVRQGILLIIPLAASLAALAAGPLYGFVVICLMFPAMSLAAWFRVT